MTITTQHDLCKCNSCTSLHDLSSNMNLLRDMWLIRKEIKDTTYSALWSIHGLIFSVRFQNGVYGFLTLVHLRILILRDMISYCKHDCCRWSGSTLLAIGDL